MTNRGHDGKYGYNRQAYALGLSVLWRDKSKIDKQLVYERALHEGGLRRYRAKQNKRQARG